MSVIYYLKNLSPFNCSNDSCSAHHALVNAGEREIVSGVFCKLECNVLVFVFLVLSFSHSVYSEGHAKGPYTTKHAEAG